MSDALPFLDVRADPLDLLFPAQRAFARDTAKFRTAVCSRRAGKTIGCAAALLRSALDHDDSTNLYITRSRKNAKRILWSTLKRMNLDCSLGGEANESDLFLRFANGSTIYLAGANDRDAIEDFRGLAMALAVIDEAQSMPAYIEELVDAVLVPALMDFDGALALIGTPGPVPAGYFADAAGVGKNTVSGSWSPHKWTAFDNPHLEKKSGKKARQLMREELARRGVTEENPTIQREWFGRWVEDADALVFHVSADNMYDTLPAVDGEWQYVIGVDIGFNDADAIVVLGFHPRDPACWQIEEWVGTKQIVSELATRLNAMVDKYRPISIVMDEGGLGKKIAEELRRRPPFIPIKAAEKSRKFEFIALVNDALRTNKLRVRRDSRIVDDARLIEWDRNKSTPDRMVVSDRHHSDVLDALLYSYRESLHWLHEPKPAEPPRAGTDAYFAAEETRMFDAAITSAQEMERERQEWV